MADIKDQGARTEYAVLALAPDTTKTWVEAGNYTVRSGNTDGACKLAIADLLKEEPDMKRVRLVAIPVRSWNPKDYGEKPQPVVPWGAM